MGLVDRNTLKKYWLPRNSIAMQTSLDFFTHSYKFTFAPDKKKYDLSVSIERDGVTLFMSQPNESEYFPTWSSGHCEYLEQGGDTAFNCNCKGVIGGKTKEMSLNSKKQHNFFELGAILKQDTNQPVDFNLRYTFLPTHVFFTRLTSEFVTFGK
jgi:hypothetical protein